jgi:ribosomal protein S18 acetylase RimI-like enzyme
MRISEIVNYDLFKKGYRQSKSILNGEYTIYVTAGYIEYGSTKTESKQVSVVIRNQEGTEIGWANFERDGDSLSASDIDIKPAYRRKGIGTEVYQFLRELGNTIVPSKLQTDLGKKFWDKSNVEYSKDL